MTRFHSTIKWITVGLLVVFVNFTIGCTSSNQVFMERDEYIALMPNDHQGLSSGKIAKLKREDGVIVTFNEEGAIFKESYLGEDSVFVGFLYVGELSVTPLTDVETIWIEKSETNYGGTVLLTLGAAAAAIGVLFVSIMVIWAIDK